MSDLFGNHIVGFPTRWLILLIIKEVVSAYLMCLIIAIHDILKGGWAGIPHPLVPEKINGLLMYTGKAYTLLSDKLITG